jgi:transposase
MEDAMARYELEDDQWELLKGLMPTQRGGGQWLDHRTTLNGMLWILRSGAAWRDLPERYGKWQSVYHRFTRWRRDGTFDRILKALQIRLDKQGKIDWDLWLVDGTSVRASRAAAGARKKSANQTHANPRTTHWVAAAADSGANSTWLLTEQALFSEPRSLRGRRTSRRNSTT